jgi:hypothetical protein
VHEDTAEVLRILVDPVVERLHVLLVEIAQDPLLELARSLTGIMTGGGKAFRATNELAWNALPPIDSRIFRYRALR